MSTRLPQQARRWLPPAALAIAVLTLAALLLTIWREPVLGIFLHADRLETLVRRLGPAGPLALIVLQMVQILFAPIPGQLVGIAGGYLYGPWLGTLYNMIGVVCGNALSLWVARRFGRPAVERLCHPAVLARVDRLTGRLGLPVILLIYLLPLMPGDTITLVAGLTEIPVRHLMLAVVCGRLPGILLSSLIGSRAASVPPTHWVAIGVAVAVIAALFLRFRTFLQERIWSLVERASHRTQEQ